MDLGVKRGLSKLMMKLFDYAVRRTNEKFDMSEVQHKYFLQKNKRIMLDIYDLEFQRVFYIDGGRTIMVPPEVASGVDCTISMSAQTVSDIINGESTRMLPSGKWGKMPYDAKVAWAMEDIVIDQEAFWLSDGQYFIKTFLNDLLPEIREAMGGKMPERIE